MKKLTAALILGMMAFSFVPAAAAPANVVSVASDTTTTNPKIVAAAVVNALRKNDFTILDKFVPNKDDIRATMKEKEAALKTDAEKAQFEVFLGTMSGMVYDDVKKSFEKVVTEGKTQGINWADDFKIDVEEVKGEKFPGYKIYIIYKTATGEKKVKVKADMIDRGIVVGNKIRLETE